MASVTIVKTLMRADRWGGRQKAKLSTAVGAYWIDDLLALIKYVNFVKVLLALTIIFFVPRHFFKNVPQYVARRPIWLTTPIAFFTSSMTLFALVALAVRPATAADMAAAHTLSSWQMLLALAISMPILMAQLCFFLWFVLVLFYPVPSVRRLRDIRTRMLLPSSPSLYRVLQRKEFLASILYFNVYVIFAGVVIEGVLLGTTAGLLAWFSLGLFFIAFVVAQPFVIYPLIIEPYLVLLERSVRIPTDRMLRADCYEVNRLVTNFTCAWARGQSSLAAKSLDRLERRVAVLEVQACRHDAGAQAAGPSSVRRLNEARMSVGSFALDVRRMRNSVASVPLLDEQRAAMERIFDRLETWRLHQVQIPVPRFAVSNRATPSTSNPLIEPIRPPPVTGV